MSTAYAPVPAILPATITLPQDLVDQRTAASVNVPFASLADAIAYLGQTVTVTRRMAANQPIGQNESGPIAKTFDLKALSMEPLIESDWEAYGSRIRYGVPEVTAIGPHLLYRANELAVDGATITRLTCDLIGGPAHAALPGMMPAIGLVRYSPSADTWESLLAAGMMDDASASVAAYEAIHDIRLIPDQNATVDLSTYDYYIVVCPEGSTNAQEGLSIRSFHMRNSAKRYQT